MNKQQVMPLLARLAGALALVILVSDYLVEGAAIMDELTQPLKAIPLVGDMMSGK